MNKRWGLNIDIEGFSRLYESSEENQTKAILGLKELMAAIIQIGQKAYPGDPKINESDRLFAHQFGDGFIITSEYEETNASRCISIATSLMRHMALKGYATKSAISIGSMADISGCYPDVMRGAKNDHLSLGAGLLTTISVMGTALTKAHKLGNKKSGNILIVDESAFADIPEHLVATHDNNLVFINWISDDHILAKEISAKAGLDFGTQDELHSCFERYISQIPTPPAHWITGSRICIAR